MAKEFELTDEDHGSVVVTDSLYSLYAWADRQLETGADPDGILTFSRWQGLDTDVRLTRKELARRV